jgi:hypothetical protein
MLSFLIASYGKKKIWYLQDTPITNIKMIKQKIQNSAQWCTQDFFLGGGGLTNSVQHRRQRERGSGGVGPLVRGSTQFVNQ